MTTRYRLELILFTPCNQFPPLKFNVNDFDESGNVINSSSPIDYASKCLNHFVAYASNSGVVIGES